MTLTAPFPQTVYCSTQHSMDADSYSTYVQGWCVSIYADDSLPEPGIDLLWAAAAVRGGIIFA